jgi:hypothetical protein
MEFENHSERHYCESLLHDAWESNWVKYSYSELLQERETEVLVSMQLVDHKDRSLVSDSALVSFEALSHLKAAERHF